MSTETLLTSVPCLPVIDGSCVSDISNITNTYEHEHMHLQYREHMGPYMTTRYVHMAALLAVTFTVQALILAYLQPDFLGIFKQYLYLYVV